MKIKIRIHIVNVLALFATILISVLIYSSYVTVSQIMKKDGTVEEIIAAIFDINILTSEYIMNPSDRSRTQWHITEQSINSLLDRISVEGENEKKHLREVREEYETIKENFRELIAIHAQGVGPNVNKEALRVYEQRLSESIGVMSRAMVTHAVRLGDLNHVWMMDYYARTSKLLILIVSLLFIGIFIVSIILGKSIMTPIAKLHSLTDIIAGGNLKQKTGIKTSDELGQLSRSFDKMTDQLRMTINDLEKEVRERKASELKLKNSEKKFSNLFKSIRDVIIVADNDRNIVNVNQPALRELFGYELEEVKGKKTVMLYANENEFIKTGKKVFNKKTGSPDEIMNIDYKKRSGEIFSAEVHGMKLLDSNMNTMGNIGIIRDITAKKKAEEKLRRSREMFSSVLNGIEAIVYVADMKTYEILFINEYTRKLFGNLEGKTCWHTIQTDQTGPCDFCTNDKLLAPDGKPSGIYNWEFQNTVNARWYDIRDRAIEWIDGRIVRLEIATDITERKKDENMLREIAEKISLKTGEDFFHSVTQFISIQLDVDYVLIGVLDTDKNMVDTIAVSAHGKIVNNLTYDLDGTPCDNVMGKQACIYTKNIRNLFPQDKLLIDMEAESYAGIPLFSSDRRPLGIIAAISCSPVDEELQEKYILLLKIFASKTSSELERSKAEKALIVNEQRLNLAHDAVGMGMFDWDIIRDRAFYNKRYFRLFGLDPQEKMLSMKDWLDMVHPDDRERAWDEITQSLEEKAPYDTEYRIIWPDASVKWVRSIARVFYDKEKPYRMIGAMTDITVRRQTDDLLREALKEKEVLLKEVHHRVKNNLLVLYGLITLQQSKVKTKNDFNDILISTKQRIMAMGKVHQMLYESSTLSDIDFSDYIISIVNDIQAIYRDPHKKINITYSLEPIKLSIEAAIPCGIIINELLTNAYKHSFVGRTAGNIRILFRKKQNQYELQIADDGVGISDDVLSGEGETLGLKLITLLTKQINANYHYKNENGSVFDINFKIDA